MHGMTARRRVEIICVLIAASLVVCVNSAGGTFASNCDAKNACSANFTCQHFESCEEGRCVCEPGTRYNFTIQTCYDMPPEPVGQHGDECITLYHGLCSRGLVCEQCESAAFSEIKKCRKPVVKTTAFIGRNASLPTGGYGTGNGTYSDVCKTNADCGESLNCKKSVDCTNGLCSCSEGFYFHQNYMPCVKDDTPVVPVALGGRCSSLDLKHPCVNNSICSMCPGKFAFTCIGNKITYTPPTKPNAKPKPPAKKDSGDNAMSKFVYLIIPAVFIVLFVGVFLVVRWRRVRTRGNRFVSLDSTGSTQMS